MAVRRHRLVHRLQQGVRALTSFSREIDYDLAGQYLNTGQLALFRQMRRSEQIHSLNVLRAVQSQAQQTPHELAVAALMHDVGKVRYPLAIWQKSLPVLTRALLPSLYNRLSNGQPTNPITTAFVVNRQHPAWSAELMAELGTSDRALWLIEHHADSPDDYPGHPCVGLLQRLQAADDSN